MKRRVFALTVAAALAVAGAVWGQGSAKATAQLQPTKGNTATGTATFTQRGGKVLVEVKVSGLTPGAEHGFHIHEKGDCSSGDGMSAGAHFNPLNKPHAHYSTPDRHAGDMPALKADASGNASVVAELDVITVTDGSTGIVGRGLIVHAQPDDYKTQPTGNSGARVACGVIQKG
jgi:superoxide dismutase, Cu-Zn family